MGLTHGGRRQGVVFSFVMLAAEVLSGLLFTPLVIRNLGQAEFGIYNLSLSITTCFTLLDLGVGSASIRFMSKYRFSGDRAEEKRFLGLVVMFYAVISAFIVAVYLIVVRPRLEFFFGTGLTADEIALLGTLLDVTIANAVFTMLASPYDKELISYERFDYSKGFSILRVFLRIGIVLVLFAFGFHSIAIVAVNFGLTVIFGLLSVVVVAKKLRLVPSFHGIRGSLVREMLGFTVFIFVQNIATQINAVVGQILLGAYASSAVLGIYSIAVQINQYYQLMGNAVNSVLMPGIVRLVERGASARRLEDEMVKVARLQFVILGLILAVFLVVGEDFIVLWAGDDYGSAFIPTVILLVPVCIAWSQLVGSQILWALGRLREQAFIKLGVTLGCAVLTWFLVRAPDPVLGAAVGTTMGVLVSDVIIAAVLYKRIIGISLIRFAQGVLRGILPSLLVAIACGGLFSSFIQGPVVRFLAISSVMILAFLACMGLFGFSDYERYMLRRYVRLPLRRAER